MAMSYVSLKGASAEKLCESIANGFTTEAMEKELDKRELECDDNGKPVQKKYRWY